MKRCDRCRQEDNTDEMDQLQWGSAGAFQHHTLERCIALLGEAIDRLTRPEAYT